MKVVTQNTLFQTMQYIIATYQVKLCSQINQEKTPTTFNPYL